MSNNGHLIIAGGNIGKSGKKIYGEFLKYAGSEAKICIVVVSSEIPQESYATTKSILLSLGAKADNISCLPLTTIPSLIRQGWYGDGDEKALLPYFDGVTAVWFVGGDQIKTVSVLLKNFKTDTVVLKRIREILKCGGVIGGTSAGATIMGKFMIGAGNDDGALTLPVEYDVVTYERENREKSGQLLMTRGFGFFDKGILDQHFNKRARMQRLFAAIDTTGSKKGFGISEDTAIIYDLYNKSAKVVGEEYVCFVVNCDKGRKLTYYYEGDVFKC